MLLKLSAWHFGGRADCVGACGAHDCLACPIYLLYWRYWVAWVQSALKYDIRVHGGIVGTTKCQDQTGQDAPRGSQFERVLGANLSVSAARQCTSQANCCMHDCCCAARDTNRLAASLRVWTSRASPGTITHACAAGHRCIPLLRCC